MGERPRVMRLEEFEQVPGPGSLVWLPVRMTLGVKSFGCNAYTAKEAGQDVVEPHAEAPSFDHQELYFVASGRARFELDGESCEAPAGTYVFVPDPATRRHAVAEEAGTTVLSFGGPPTFEPSAWEWAFRATPLMRRDPDEARRILHEGLAAHPQAGGLHYNLACLEALSGKRAEALEHLRRAISDRSEAAEWAREDEDFSALRGDAEFQQLIGGAG